MYRKENPLPPHIVRDRDRVTILTLDILRERGLTQSHPLYTEVENMPHFDQENGQHTLIIEWPDGITSMFSAVDPVSIDDLFPGYLEDAYSNSFYEGKRTFWLG